MVLTLFIVVFIFLMQFLWLWIDELAGKGLSWHVILELIGWVSLTFVPISLPLSTLLSSLMTLGNLGENNELLALKASGISLYRILSPLYVTVFFVAVFSFFMSSNIVAYANFKMRLKFSEIRKKNPELSIPVGIFYNGIEGYSIRIDDKDAATGMMKGVMLYDHTQGEGNVSVSIADSGQIKQTGDGQHIIFKLFNGITYEEQTTNKKIDRSRYPFVRRTFRSQTVVINLDKKDDGNLNEGFFRNQAQSQSLSSLNKSNDSLSNLHTTRLHTFETMSMQSQSAFRYGIKPDSSSMSIREIHPKYLCNVDSIFAASTATEKINYLEKAANSANRVISTWNIELREIELVSKSMYAVRYERYRKFTLALACIIFFFTGAPLGAIIRKGGLGMPIVISVLFFVFYWVIDSICRKMVINSGSWSPWFGAWFPSMVLTPIAIFLTYKAGTDSQLFNPDAYLKVFNIITGRMKKLVRRINLDNIQELSSDSFAIEKLLIPEYLDNLTDLCTAFLDKHRRLHFFKRQDEISKELIHIESVYEKLLIALAGIDDNEKLRSLVKDYPFLKASKYKVPKFSKLKAALMLIVFPIGLTEAVLLINKRRQLKYILSEIINISNNLSKILTSNQQ
jgi:lipopolysaccharide export system permease protein